MREQTIAFPDALAENGIREQMGLKQLAKVVMQQSSVRDCQATII